MDTVTLVAVEAVTAPTSVADALPVIPTVNVRAIAPIKLVIELPDNAALFVDGVDGKLLRGLVPRGENPNMIYITSK